MRSILKVSNLMRRIHHCYRRLTQGAASESVSNRQHYVQTSGSDTLGAINVDNEAEKTGILRNVMRTDKKNNINQPRYH